MKVIVPIKNNYDQGLPYGTSLYEIDKKPLIEYVYKNLLSIQNAEFIFVLNKTDVAKHHIDDILKMLSPKIKIVISDGDTKGSACSCLLAIDYLDREDELIISNGNQITDENFESVLTFFRTRNLDGGMTTFESVHPRWSYARLDSYEDDTGFSKVIETSEKRPISNVATTGFYYFKKAGDFIDSTLSMIKKKAHIGDKYYVCPVYNELILQQKLIGTYKVPNEKYFSLNYIKDIEAFEQSLLKK